MTISTLAVTEFIKARLRDWEEAAISEADPYVTRVEDPEGKYWWECEWCSEGGHVPTAAAAPAAQVEHAKADHPTNPRVLAQCAAMRQIVVECSESIGDGRGDDGSVLTSGGQLGIKNLRHLASIWSDHPDWREDWSG